MHHRDGPARVSNRLLHVKKVGRDRTPIRLRLPRQLCEAFPLRRLSQRVEQNYRKHGRRNKGQKLWVETKHVMKGDIRIPDANLPRERVQDPRVGLQRYPTD